jgi:hypothetical protein
LDLTLLLMLGLAACAALAVADRAARRRREADRRRITGVPETPIAAVKGGQKVRIRGQAVARGPLRTAPVSQRSCIGYRVVVDRHDYGVEGLERAVEEQAFDAFVLADGTGEAVVHGPFEIKLDSDHTGFENHPPALFDLLERRGVARRDGYGWERHFQYVETVLMPGDEIVAVGHATIEVDPAGRAPSHREPPVTCHLKGDDEPVLLAEAEAGADADARSTTS